MPEPVGVSSVMGTGAEPYTVAEEENTMLLQSYLEAKGDVVTYHICLRVIISMKVV